MLNKLLLYISRSALDAGFKVVPVLRLNRFLGVQLNA